MAEFTTDETDAGLATGKKAITVDTIIAGKASTGPMPSDLPFIAIPIYNKEIPLDNLKYHQQSEEGYCGAACAMMALHGQPFNISFTVLPTQDDLNIYIQDYSKAYEPEITWFAEPDGFEAALNDLKDSVIWYFHLNTTFKSEKPGSRQIVLDLESRTVPVIALVFGYQHWLIVRGFQTNVKPADKSKFDILGMWLFDPRPVNVGLAHSDTDGCGSGGDRGTRKEFVTYAKWKAKYFTGIPAAVHSTWRGDYLVIEELLRIHIDDLMPGGIIIPGALGSIGLTGSPFIDAATQGLTKYGLDQNPDWASIIAGSTAGSAYEVEYLDSPGTYYYIVPFNSNNAVPLAVIVGRSVSVDLEFEQAIAAKDIDHDALIIQPPIDALNGLIGRTLNLDGKIVTVKSSNIPLPQQPPLKWKPCLQSFSPFVPFYETIVRDDDQIPQSHIVYVRASDKEPFTALKDDIGGA